MPPTDDLSKSQGLLDHLREEGIAEFKVSFVPLECELLFQDWVGPNLNLFLEEGQFDKVDKS